MSQIERARNIAVTLGTFKAARYLKARGWSIEAAMHILVTSQPIGERHAKRKNRGNQTRVL